MRTTIFITIFLCLILSACNRIPSAEINPPSPTMTQSIGAVAPTATSSVESNTAPRITGVDWDSGSRVITISIDPWPNNWEPWSLFLDGIEIPQREESGAISLRPNAPLADSPDGLILGTLPWVSGLGAADIPCCGTVQLGVPAMGMTNSYEYNLADFGCETASSKKCSSEWTVHEGDWIIEGPVPITIENTKIVQRGHVYIRNGAKLILKGSDLRMERGDSPTIHVYIFVDPGGSLEVDHSRIYPGPGESGLACLMNRGRTKFVDSPTAIHYFDMSDGADLFMTRSEMIGEIGGLLQVAGGDTKVSDSTIGALGLSVPAGAHLELSGLTSGVYFDHWSVQDWIPEARYGLTFDRVTVLADDFEGEYEHGPYERGWIFFLDPDSHVRLSDSELRKVFIDIYNETVEFHDLKIGEPSSLSFRDIILKDVVVQGQWPFTITNANLTITDSNYLFLQPRGSSSIKLINSHIVEFIPREFTGRIIFENGTWTNAGEILGGLAYHSNSNNFTIQGSLKIGEDVRRNLQWKDAQVTREFEVLLTDSHGDPLPNGLVKVGGQEYATDEGGLAIFSILFNEENYNQPTSVEIWGADGLIDRRVVDFFTETPIKVIQ